MSSRVVCCGYPEPLTPPCPTHRARLPRILGHGLPELFLDHRDGRYHIAAYPQFAALRGCKPENICGAQQLDEEFIYVVYKPGSRQVLDGTTVLRLLNAARRGAINVRNAHVPADEAGAMTYGKHATSDPVVVRAIRDLQLTLRPPPGDASAISLTTRGDSDGTTVRVTLALPLLIGSHHGTAFCAAPVERSLEGGVTATLNPGPSGTPNTVTLKFKVPQHAGTGAGLGPSGGRTDAVVNDGRPTALDTVHRIANFLLSEEHRLASETTRAMPRVSHLCDSKERQTLGGVECDDTGRGGVDTDDTRGAAAVGEGPTHHHPVGRHMAILEGRCVLCRQSGNVVTTTDGVAPVVLPGPSEPKVDVFDLAATSEPPVPCHFCEAYVVHKACSAYVYKDQRGGAPWPFATCVSCFIEQSYIPSPERPPGLTWVVDNMVWALRIARSAASAAGALQGVVDALQYAFHKRKFVTVEVAVKVTATATATVGVDHTCSRGWQRDIPSEGKVTVRVLSVDDALDTSVTTAAIAAAHDVDRGVFPVDTECEGGKWQGKLVVPLPPPRDWCDRDRSKGNSRDGRGR